MGKTAANAEAFLKGEGFQNLRWIHRGRVIPPQEEPHQADAIVLRQFPLPHPDPRKYRNPTRPVLLVTASETQVPDLRGLTEGQAMLECERSGLNMLVQREMDEDFGPPDPNGTDVIDCEANPNCQSPAPNVTVTEGSDLYVILWIRREVR